MSDTMNLKQEKITLHNLLAFFNFTIENILRKIVSMIKLSVFENRVLKKFYGKRHKMLSGLSDLFYKTSKKKNLSLLVLGCLIFLISCQDKNLSETVKNKNDTIKQYDKKQRDELKTLDDVIQGEWRIKDSPRDPYRHPVKTLTFFDVQPNMRIAEIWPGRGWYTRILAPWLHANGGELIAVLPFWGEQSRQEGDNASKFKRYNDEFIAQFQNKALYGEMKISDLSENSLAISSENSLDAILTFRNIHNWMAGRYAEKVFHDFYLALKPGGILGVVEHKLPSSKLQDPFARSGYVQEEYVKRLAKEAGFEFVGRSEINLNPKDDAEHPNGVWTLMPARRSPKPGSKEAETFDRAAYDAIGESSRMTLKFRKPVRKIQN